MPGESFLIMNAAFKWERVIKNDDFLSYFINHVKIKINIISNE